jgi:hypothetical protein
MTRESVRASGSVSCNHSASPGKALTAFVEVKVFPDDAFPYAFELRHELFDLSDIVLKLVLIVPCAGAALIQEADEELLHVRLGDLLGV